eukprot:g62146.t1
MSKANSELCRNANQRSEMKRGSSASTQAKAKVMNSFSVSNINITHTCSCGRASRENHYSLSCRMAASPKSRRLWKELSSSGSKTERVLQHQLYLLL